MNITWRIIERKFAIRVRRASCNFECSSAKRLHESSDFYASSKNLRFPKCTKLFYLERYLVDTNFYLKLISLASVGKNIDLHKHLAKSISETV